MAEEDLLTIDQLAQRAGMTVRNVRAHQARGLLAAPEIKGRTGFYGPEHVARLELVKDLQAEGFTLESISRIIDRAPAGSVAEVLDFTRAVTAPFTDEQPVVVEASELIERWGGQLTPEVARRTERLGFVRPLGDGRYEVLSPRLERGAEELAQLGVPLTAALELMAQLNRHAEAAAQVYVRLFLEHIWRPFEAEEEGAAEEHWTDVREALERLRPLASESMLAVFGLAMNRQVELALERELSKLAGARRPPSTAPAPAPGRARRSGRRRDQRRRSA